MSSKKPTVDEVLASLKQSNRYDIEVGPNGMKLRTDGTNKDHHDMLETLGRMSDHPWFKEMMSASASPSTPPTSSNPALTPISLIDANEKWVQFLKPTTRVVKTLDAKKKALNDLLAWDKARGVKVTDINRTLCAQFAQHLMDTGNKKNTASNKMLWLAHFFEWAQASGYYPQGDNPARGHLEVTEADKTHSAKKFGWRAFTPEELSRIFNPIEFQSMEEQHARWAIMIGLFTGARVNEIAQLPLDSFIIEDGVKCIHIDPVQMNIKTDSSERVLPIHSTLVDLGLWKRVENLRQAGETYLFPSLDRTVKNGPGNTVTTTFSRHLKRVGIEKVGTTKTGFHSFRDTVEVTLKRNGVGIEARQEFTGHDQKRDSHSRSYSEKFSARALAKHVLPSLVFDNIDFGAFKSLLET